MSVNKKAISTLVAYVLLIGMTIAMAGAVYAWLRFYVMNPLPTEKCPAEVNIIIYDYNCTGTTLNLAIQNRGNFNISGYIVKINNNSKEELAGKYPLCREGHTCETIDYVSKPDGTAIPPLGIFSAIFDFTAYGELDMIEIEPFRYVPSKHGESTSVLCDKATLIQKIDPNKCKG